MKKSPGKWIKSMLFRKKSSKSTVAKRGEIPKSSFERESLAPSQEPVSSLAVQQFSISQPGPVTFAGGNEIENVESGIGDITTFPNDEPALTSLKQDGGERIETDHVVTNESEKHRLEQAATRVQATFRGYQARRSFQTLKGIIRLQAVIRGHLVRRQAVATLYCVLGIVKLQALIRGRMVRHSDHKCESEGKQNLYVQNVGMCCSGSLNTCGQGRKLLRNGFIRQLLSSTSTVRPLCLYDPDKPNSAWNWLLRWTVSHVWGPHHEKEKTIDSKSKVESERALPKSSGQKRQSANVEIASLGSTLETEKVKRNSRKVSNQQVRSVQEQAWNEIDKGKHNTKRVSNSGSDDPGQAEVDTEIPRRRLWKSSKSPGPQLSVGETLINYSGDHPESDAQDKQLSIMNETPKLKEDQLVNEIHKISRRRASLPANRDVHDTGKRGTKVPSYMVATESAKAKVRGPGSPRFGEDMVERSLTRRYSLPSAVNVKLSSSPRLPRLIPASGKGGSKLDRSLSSSRDSNEKLVQPEWRR